MTSGHSIEYEICDLHFTVAISSWPHEICTGDIWHAGHCSSVPHEAGEPGGGYGTSHRLHWTKAGRVRQTWNLPWPRELIQSIAMWIRCLHPVRAEARVQHQVLTIYFLRQGLMDSAGAHTSWSDWWARKLQEPPVFAFPAGTGTQVCSLSYERFSHGAFSPGCVLYFTCSFLGHLLSLTGKHNRLCISFPSLY